MLVLRLFCLFKRRTETNNRKCSSSPCTVRLSRWERVNGRLQNTGHFGSAGLTIEFRTNLNNYQKELLTFFSNKDFFFLFIVNNSQILFVCFYIEANVLS